MDLPVQGLYQQLHARAISGEHLETLGKHAAEGWADGKYKTLTEAVVETVKHAGLSPEQVRRVVEFTNTEAFQREFRKESALHRVVTFPHGPADPADVLRDLNDGGGGSVFDRGTADYDLQPRKKRASADDVERGLAEMFQTSGGADYPSVEPLSEAVDLRYKLASAYDDLTAKISGLETMFADLSERVYDGVKQATLSGTSLGVIGQAFEAVAPTSQYFTAAFSYLAPRLMEDGVFSSLEQMQSSIDKTAEARVVNREHPMLVDFGEYCQVLSKLAHFRGAHEEVRECLGQLNLFMKKAARGGILPAAGRILSRGGELASQAVTPIAEQLYEGSGQRAGEIASKAVRYGVPLVAANEVRRHVKYNPTIQGVKDTALSVVPMTPQYQQREYEIATGM